MEYKIALNKAWDELAKITQDKRFSVPFLNDTYSIDLEKREVLSLSCNVAAKPFYSIIILHYLTKKESTTNKNN